jgi:hypothetical protein
MKLVLGQNGENRMNGCVFRRRQYIPELEGGEYVKACSVNVLCKYSISGTAQPFDCTP